MNKTKGNLIMPDTNILLGDRDAVLKLIDGNNLVVIPLTVLSELDGLKRDSRISSEVRRVIAEIESLIVSDNPHFVVEKNMKFDGLNLPSDKPDNQILATFNYVVENPSIYGAYQKYKLITEDINMRVIAHSLFKNLPQVSVEKYRANVIEPKQLHDIVEAEVLSSHLSLDYDEKIMGEIPENGGIILKLISHPEASEQRDDNKLLAIRKGEKLEIIPSDLELFGLKPAHNGEINFGQLLAFRQLIDPGIHCVFISGPAGTGKTLMAIAAALEQKDRFEQLIIASPMVSLSNNQKMGYLPGDTKDKSAPWLTPFNQNIRFLETKQRERMMNAIGGPKGTRALKSKKSEIEFDSGDSINLWEKYGFICQPLEYIRGQTIAKANIIFEEAQNLSQHEIKTIITRAGEGTKIVFCGDLSQIDLPYLSVRTSGLTYAIERLSGLGYKSKMIGVTVLTKAVRSKLSAFATEVM